MNLLSDDPKKKKYLERSQKINQNHITTDEQTIKRNIMSAREPPPRPEAQTIRNFFKKRNVTTNLNARKYHSTEIKS